MHSPHFTPSRGPSYSLPRWRKQMITGTSATTTGHHSFRVPGDVGVDLCCARRWPLVLDVHVCYYTTSLASSSYLFIQYHFTLDFDYAYKMFIRIKLYQILYVVVWSIKQAPLDLTEEHTCTDQNDHLRFIQCTSIAVWSSTIHLFLSGCKNDSMLIR